MFAWFYKGFNYNVSESNVVIQNGGFYSAMISFYCWAFFIAIYRLFFMPIKCKKCDIWQNVFFCTSIFYRRIFCELIVLCIFFENGKLSGKQHVFQIDVLHRVQASKEIVKNFQNGYFSSEVRTTLDVWHLTCHHVTQSLAL